MIGVLTSSSRLTNVSLWPGFLRHRIGQILGRINRVVIKLSRVKHISRVVGLITGAVLEDVTRRLKRGGIVPLDGVVGLLEEDVLHPHGSGPAGVVPVGSDVEEVVVVEVHMPVTRTLLEGDMELNSKD